MEHCVLERASGVFQGRFRILRLRSDSPPRGPRRRQLEHFRAVSRCLHHHETRYQLEADPGGGSKVLPPFTTRMRGITIYRSPSLQASLLAAIALSSIIHFILPSGEDHRRTVASPLVPCASFSPIVRHAVRAHNATVGRSSTLQLIGERGGALTADGAPGWPTAPCNDNSGSRGLQPPTPYPSVMSQCSVAVWNVQVYFSQRSGI